MTRSMFRPALLAAVSLGLGVQAHAQAAFAPSGRPMIPTGVTLTSPTAAEAQANALWSLRAALNVAALQCQYSPFLATVRTYNDFLRHHGDELAGAMRTMTGHFRRTAPKTAQRLFDSYTTRTYQSYATLDAQREFCEQAALSGRQALMIRKSRLGASAAELVAPLRASLTPAARDLTLVTTTLAFAPEPFQLNLCLDDRGRPLRRVAACG